MKKSLLLTVVCTCVFALSVVTTSDGVAKPPNNPPEDLNENAILSLLTPKTIFVTSDRYTGDLVNEAMLLGSLEEDGLAAADYICKYHAENAGLKGNYVAIISTSTVNANAKLTTSLGPYHVVTGTPVAANFSALFSTYFGYIGSDTRPETSPVLLISPVRYDENGVRMPSSGGSLSWKSVWTGSTALGEIPRLTPGTNLFPSINTCLDWTTSAEAIEDCENLNSENCGVTGLSTNRTEQWLNFETVGCDELRRLYCAEL